MLSAGMLPALASAMIVRRRGFMSGSPPPARAATVSSLMRRVKILPRLASSGALLVLDRVPTWNGRTCAETPRKSNENRTRNVYLFLRARMIQTSARVVPRAARGSRRAPRRPRNRRVRAAPRHLPDRQRAERQLETVLARARPPRRSMYRCSNVVRRRARSWRTDSTA